MTLEELKARIESGTIDTVLLALTDMQGRLQGKRLTPRAAFVDHYAHAAAIELTAFETAVTDWERRRGFERL